MFPNPRGPPPPANSGQRRAFIEEILRSYPGSPPPAVSAQIRDFAEDFLRSYPPPPATLDQRRAFAENFFSNYPLAPLPPPLYPSPPAECPICLDEFPENQMHTGPCTHKVCRNCYVTLRIDSRYHVGGPNAYKAICHICRFGPDTDPTGQQRGFGKVKKCRKCGGVKHC